MKISSKIILALALYTLMCSGILILADHESTKQPIGLLVVAIIMTLIIVSIFGGLPVDFIKEKFYDKQDS